MSDIGGGPQIVYRHTVMLCDNGTPRRRRRGALPRPRRGPRTGVHGTADGRFRSAYAPHAGTLADV
ncbi:hypothetical protein, partial [Frankia sp. CpI1-P]|uniref:hypothetical protein n=1 Tax=Frankia sp. CpI1-P TaxID=1502734 RepID=UPI001A7E65AF